MKTKYPNLVVLAMFAFIAIPSRVSSTMKTNRLMNMRRWREWVSIRPAFTILSLLIVLLITVPGAVAQCIDEVTGLTNVCTANDVRVGTFYRIEGPTECMAGETIQVQLQAQIISGASDRYDIGLFVAQDGGNARTGACYHDYLPIPLADLFNYNPGVANPGSGGGPFYDAEKGGDFCGDLRQGIPTFRDVGEVTTSPQPGSGPVWITVECQDIMDANGNPNPDGIADVGTCVSWDNQVDSMPECTSINQAVPNTKSKCSCESIPVSGITVFQPANIVIVKQTDPVDSELTFEFSTDYSPNFILSDGQLNDSGPLMPGTYSVSEIVPDGWDLTAICDDGSIPSAIDVQQGETVTCTFTNTFVGIPSIALVKSLLSNADKDASDTVSLGDTLTYQFIARNDGDVTLTGVTITDPMTGLSALTCGQAQPATLAPGALLNCTAAYVVTQADVDAGEILNTAKADSTETDPVNASNNVSIPQNPALSNAKSLLGNADEDASGTVSLGDTLTYQFVARNDGDVTLTGVTITDPLPGMSTLTCDMTQPATLAPGASLTCTAAYVVTQDDVNAGNIIFSSYFNSLIYIRKPL